jgi:nitrate/TMAO reductase-like tetraheme cytochrome c subunit
MLNFNLALIAFILVTVALVAVLILRPSLAAARGGKVLAFFILFLMPVVILWAGTELHLEHAKSTSFCLSCHVMEPYGESLWLNDTGHLPASHFQHNRVSRDAACYTCHTSYTMFGGVKSKLKGLQHLYVNYLGTVPETIQLYEPFSNLECLHCHEGARNFLDFHGDMMGELESNETSCLECHDQIHAVKEVDQLEKWEGAEP